MSIRFFFCDLRDTSDLCRELSEVSRDQVCRRALHIHQVRKGCENMARILTEKRNINDNVFEYEKRLQSPYNRYIDKFPTYVTYYHISNDNTTVNEGWKDTEQLLGENSSLRFQKITDFP